MALPHNDNADSTLQQLTLAESYFQVNPDGFAITRSDGSYPSVASGFSVELSRNSAGRYEVDFEPDGGINGLIEVLSWFADSAHPVALSIGSAGPGTWVLHFDELTAGAAGACVITATDPLFIAIRGFTLNDPTFS